MYKVKKGASYMWNQSKRPKKVLFYTSILSKLHILSEKEKNILIEKQKRTKH